MDVIEVLDVATLTGNSGGTWYKQKTSGDIPLPRVDACVIAATAPDNSSTNMLVSLLSCQIAEGRRVTDFLACSYLYGGRNDTAIFDQLYVLSLPSFTWVKVRAYIRVLWSFGTNITKIFEGQSPRYGMTCHLMGERQLITVGGYSSLNLTSGCDWEDKGVGVYDVSALLWGSRYLADAGGYTVPTPVVSAIGGR
jgi:Kelch motif